MQQRFHPPLSCIFRDRFQCALELDRVAEVLEFGFGWKPRHGPGSQRLYPQGSVPEWFGADDSMIEEASAPAANLPSMPSDSRGFSILLYHRPIGWENAVDQGVD